MTFSISLFTILFVNILFSELDGRRRDEKGLVGFFVGGYQKRVELYSPEGLCQHQLAPIPIDGNYFTSPVLVYVNETIIAGAGEQNNKYFWTYNSTSNQWKHLTTSNYAHIGMPGLAHKHKIYLVDDKNPEVYNVKEKTWSTWPAPLIRTRWGSCMVLWRDSFILFGGRDHPKLVQSYNITTQRWSILSYDDGPIYMWYSSCMVLPDEDVLILGSVYLNYSTSSAIYSVLNNTWTSLPNGRYDRRGSNMIAIGARIYAIGGGFNPPTLITEEFQYCANIFTPLRVKLLYARRHFGAITVPDTLFKHLDGGCEGVYG